MKVLIGSLIIIVSVILGYVLGAGRLVVLWQPAEFLIIIGVAVGGYIIGNTKDVLKKTPGIIISSLKGSNFNKKDYLELLTILFGIFKVVKHKGTLVLDEHLENPEKSPWFEAFPSFFHNKEAMVFLCDYLRMVVMGADNAKQINDLMEEELAVIASEEHRIDEALAVMSDSMPAVGIIAAVLGVIHSMGAIDQPPEVLGSLIGGALVGTFTGILLSYGFVGPIARNVRLTIDNDLHYLKCIHASIVAFLNGSPPLIAAEAGRKSLRDEYRPNFFELEAASETVAERGIQ